MRLQRTFRFLIVLLMVACGNRPLHADNTLKPIPDLPVFNLNADSIYYPMGDKAVFTHFFSKLDTLRLSGKGHVNILHIGGSHIQAGMFSNQIRRNLASVFPSVNRDMIFPFSVAKTNNPVNYRSRYTGKWQVAKNVQRNPVYELGLTGMCVGTTDPAATIFIQMKGDTINPLNDTIRTFSCVYVLANNDAPLTPCVETMDSCFTGEYDPVYQAYVYHLPCKVDSFRLRFENNPDLTGTTTDFRLRGFWLDNPQPGISYVDIGVNGASVPSYLKCSLLEQDLALVKPDLCILSIGINDASGYNFDVNLFQENYKELIRRIRSVAPDCVILFTTNNDSYRRVKRSYQNNKNGALAQKAFYSLADYHKAGVWDLFSLMGGLGSMRKWEQHGLSRRDKVHFTPQGYMLLGDLVYNALMRDYLQYSTAQDHAQHVE